MTTKEAPALVDVLASLIGSDKPKKLNRPLSGGLYLAYTPGVCNEAEPGIHRLTLSRRGKYPSDNEIEIVRRELREALKRNGRAAETIYVEPYLQVVGKVAERPSDRVHYHVLFWRELVQASLL
jgi:hypothetical protein